MNYWYNIDVNKFNKLVDDFIVDNFNGRKLKFWEKVKISRATKASINKRGIIGTMTVFKFRKVWLNLSNIIYKE